MSAGSSRIRRLKIRGLRACRDELELRLDGKSLCLLADNGRGKTTLADAIELCSTGDIETFHRENCALAAAIHLDADDADVEIQVQRGPTLTRSLTKRGVGASPSDTEASLPPVPILRHSTIARFMASTAGDKKRALLSLIGLEELNGMREPLRRACTRAKQLAEEADRVLAGEQAALASQVAGQPLATYAERLRASAGVPGSITAEADILGLSLSVPQRPLDVDRAGAVDDLARALAGLADDPAVDWNREVADEAAIRADAMLALVQAAQRLVGPDTTQCPTCDSTVLGEELADRLADRAAALTSVRERLAETRNRLEAFAMQLRSLHAALNRLIAIAPSGGWPSADTLDTAANAIARHLEAVEDSRDQNAPCTAAPSTDTLRERLPELRASATTTAEDLRAAALVELAELRHKCSRVTAAGRRTDAAAAAVSATTRLLALADEEIERAIESAIARLGARTAEFYEVLVPGAVFGDLELVYRPARAGQVEFSLTFDRRHRGVSPPQRVMSTSQLDALGLALMLARLDVDEQAWGTIVLDDVVNSFGAAHRTGLARLLQTRFAGWQVLVLTHDRTFRDFLRRAVKGWRFQEVVAFSPGTGPILGDADLPTELRKRLDETGDAMELGALARRALENTLGDLLERLGFPTIHLDRHLRYTAQDYLIALRRGFARRNSSLKDLPVLGRIDASSYVVNLSVHDRFEQLMAEDLYAMLEDLDELHRALRCGECGDPVWKTHQTDGPACTCRALAA